MKRMLMLGAALMAAMPAAAAPFTLVTAAEADANAQAERNGAEDKSFFPRKADPLAPRIEVVEPATTAALTNPFDVVVRFVPQGGAQLDPKSLKVRYGTLRFDVTERLLGGATWNGNEISASGAEAPRGEHKFYVQIADTMRRVSEMKLTVIVR